MNPKKQRQNRPFVLVVALFAGAWMLLLPELDGGYLFNAMIALPEASASAQYGIKGRQAPELNLDTWIDGDGKQTAPVRLTDCRGKVVYLYFFQDW